ncbi:MAG: rod shape-determining protein MreD [Cyanobacteria bacterium P01_H01_bin.121]
MLKGFNQLLQEVPSALNVGIVIVSALLCASLMSFRFPGTELSGVGVNWLLIWVVSWSMKRNLWDGILAGIIVGLIYDGLSQPDPTHALGFAIVGACTSLLQKQRYIQEDFISVALIVFGMAVIAETVMAIQFSFTTEFADWLPGWLASSNDTITQTAGTLAPTVDSRLVDRSGMTLAEIWSYHQRVALSSAIVTSLWAPIVYYPLNRWWQYRQVLRSL